MSCKNLTNRIDDYVDDTLDASAAEALRTHVSSCAACQKTVEREMELRSLLQEYGDSSVTIPETTFFDQALVSAAREGRKQQNKRSWLTGFGSAVAAGLAVWLFVGGIMNPAVDTLPDSNIPVVTMALEEPRTVNLVFSSASELNNATLTVMLPEGVEIAGFEGQREISWLTSLREGKNVLPLQLVGTMPGNGELLATLRHGEDDRTFRLRVDVS